MRGKVRRERDKLACHKRVGMLISVGAEWWAIKQRRQVEGRQRVENDDFVRGVRVDGLLEREICRRVVKCLVQRRVGSRVFAREARDVFVQVSFALRSSNRRARTVVVVEREIVKVLVVQEVLLKGRQCAKC